MRAAPWQRRTDEPTYDHSTETLPCAKARECAALGEGLRAGPPDRERLARDQPAANRLLARSQRLRRRLWTGRLVTEAATVLVGGVLAVMGRRRPARATGSRLRTK